MSAGKGHATRPFDRAKWDASKLWKKPNMTNTPRTDAETFPATPESEDLHPTMDVVSADLARQLERELAAERAADWRALIESEVANLRAELANERALTDRLAGEIESWASIAGDYTPMSADKAIAAWKQASNPAQTTGEGAE